MYEAILKTGVLAGLLGTLGLPLSAQFRDLGPGRATGISADGTTVVGTNGSGAFTWTPAGGLVSLGQAEGDSISSDATVVSGDMASGNAGIWTAGSGWMDLGGYPGVVTGCPNLSSGYDLSRDGKVVVGLGWNGCTATAFKWTAATGMVDLGSIGGSSRANAVSGDGLTVGGWDGGSRLASVWFPNGSQSLILQGQPGNPSGLGEVFDINDDGSILVGQGSPGAFRWTQAGGVEDLGRLPGSQPPDLGMAYGVTDDGKIIVGANGSFFTGYNAFIWIEGQGMMKLTDYLSSKGITVPPGMAPSFALDISPDGKVIVGQSGNPPFTRGFVVLLPGWDAYGQGASPVNFMSMSAGGSAKIGTSVAVTTANVPASAGFTATATSLGSGNFPLFGGVLLLDPTLLQNPVLVGVPAGGSSTVMVAIPNDPTLVGTVAYQQTLAPDASQPAGWALSDGLRVVVCR